MTADTTDGVAPDAFISYSHVDREFAVHLREALERRGKEVWLDEEEIRGGTRWSDELQRAITQAGAFLFLLTPHSAASRECDAELTRALQLNKRILPLRVAETPMDALPEGLSAYQFIPSRELFSADFDRSLEQLLIEIDTDRDWVREHTDWSEKATEWERHNRDRGYLLAGSELQAAEAWRARAAGKRPGLSTLQNELIDASREVSTRRLRRTRAAVSVALAVAIGLSIVAFILRQQAVNDQQIARSGELSAQSLLQLSADPQLSLLLAVTAAETRYTAPALDALRRSIPQNHLVRTFAVNTAPLNAAALSPDGRRVLTAGEDGVARLWDAASGRLLTRLPFSNYQSQGASFAAAAPKLLLWGAFGVRVLASSGSGPTVQINDGSFGKLQDAKISPDGSLVATTASGGDGAELIFSARTGRLLHTLARPGPNNVTIAFSPDSRLLATGDEIHGRATVWHTQSGRPARVLQVAPANMNVLEVIFSPDGRLLAATAAGTREDTATTSVFALDSGRRLGQVPGASAAFSPGGGYLATVQSDGTAGVYRAKDGQTLAQLRSTTKQTGPVVFGPDRQGNVSTLLTGSRNGVATLWNAQTGTALETLAGDAGNIAPAGYTTSGQQVLTFSGDGAARLWDTGEQAPVRAPAPHALRALAANDLTTPEYALRPDPLSVLRSFGSYAKPLSVIDVRSGASVATLPPPPGSGPNQNAALDPAGRTLLLLRATSAGPLPAELHLARGGTLVHVLFGPGSRATAGTVSSDGRLVAALDAQRDIGVWSVASGRRLAVFRGHEGGRTAYGPANVDFRFSPDGRLVLSADEAGRAFVWQASSGRILSRLPGEPVPLGQYQGMGGAISPDDRLVVVVRSWDDTAHVYRIGRPRELVTLRGHADGISDATFSPDGSLIATLSSGDSTARVWDTAHADPLLTLPLGDYATRVEFSADGRSLVTDGAVPYETLPCLVCGGFPRLLTLARQRETRGFTAEERSLYLGG